MTTHGYALNVDLDPAPFTEWITACGLEGAAFTTMARELGRPLTVDEVRPRPPRRSPRSFGLTFEEQPMQSSLPVAERPRRPEWMKVRAPSADGRYFDVKKLIHGASLHTICEEARCPNIAECWGRGTATFQILGDTCTRACRYCYVHSGRPSRRRTRSSRCGSRRRSADGPQARRRHLGRPRRRPDRGAGHYAATIRALKKKCPQASVEVLTPDFLGVEEQALPTVLAERPEVFNHNIETGRRLHRRMRGAKASYDKALWLLRRAKELADYPVLTKSGIIVGLGETNDEVVETMRDLRAHGVDVVTIGQYLQPSPQHAQIDRWVHPGRVPLAARAGRVARLRLRLRRPARPLELPRRRAAPRRRDRPRRRRLLSRKGKGPATRGLSVERTAVSYLSVSSWRSASLAARLVVVRDDHDTLRRGQSPLGRVDRDRNVRPAPGARFETNIPCEIEGFQTLNFAVPSIGRRRR